MSWPLCKSLRYSLQPFPLLLMCLFPMYSPVCTCKHACTHTPPPHMPGCFTEAQMCSTENPLKHTRTSRVIVWGALLVAHSFPPPSSFYFPSPQVDCVAALEQTRQGHTVWFWCQFQLRHSFYNQIKIQKAKKERQWGDDAGSSCRLGNDISICQLIHFPLLSFFFPFSVL